MEYEHLFAESDIEESDVTAIGPYTNSTHPTASENNFVYGNYLTQRDATGDSQEYWQSDLLCGYQLNRPILINDYGVKSIYQTQRDNPSYTPHICHLFFLYNASLNSINDFSTNIERT